MQRSSSQTLEQVADRRSVVLVVDDEKGPRESLRMILSSGYRVLTANGGDSALGILRGQPVDLVTVDLNMPGTRGDALVGIIRDEFPGIEIIIITGFATIEAAVGGIRRRVCDFLTKPFDVVQVNAAVTHALQRQQERRSLVRFLESLGQVVGRDPIADDILREVRDSESLQRRLQALLDSPRVQPKADRRRAIEPRIGEFPERTSEKFAQ